MLQGSEAASDPVPWTAAAHYDTRPLNESEPPWQGGGSAMHSTHPCRFKCSVSMSMTLGADQSPGEALTFASHLSQCS